jgi:hypothetical protein
LLISAVVLAIWLRVPAPAQKQAFAAGGDEER